MTKLQELIAQIEEKQLFEIDIAELPPTNIIAFNELRSCADIYRMVEKKQLEIQPDYQRLIVWDNAEQSRFIDSLIKSLPIPSMCISMDEKSRKRQVIDGLQRMYTIIKFLSDEDWILSNLRDIEPRISNKSNLFIKENEAALYEAVENLMIPITVIRCDYDNVKHTNYLFIIFHRLNSGGKKLTNQEIRNCIYNGAFNNLLKELKKPLLDSEIFINRPGKIDRMELEEFILRFFAFEELLEIYDGNLSQFLNDYMRLRTKVQPQQLEPKRQLFHDTLNAVETKFNIKRINTLNKTVIEGILIGISKNLENIAMKSFEHVDGLLDKLEASLEFSNETLKEGTGSKEKVKSRLYKAIDIFSK
jgi:hypothetical protein